MVKYGGVTAELKHRSSTSLPFENVDIILKIGSYRLSQYAGFSVFIPSLDIFQISKWASEIPLLFR